MSILVVDIGGSGIKILATGQETPRRFPSGPALTPAMMVAGVRELAGEWRYDAVAIGYPGLVLKGRIAREPHNLAPGWVEFDFGAAFQRPVRIINDAAMQALGCYQGGTMLFLGFGTGLGSTLIADGVVIPMELAHLSYKNGTYEDYLGRRGLERLGKKKWRKQVSSCVGRLISALHLDDVVLGGGNAKKLSEMPKGCRAGANANAFLGGFRLWEHAAPNGAPATASAPRKETPEVAPARRMKRARKSAKGRGASIPSSNT